MLFWWFYVLVGNGVPSLDQNVEHLSPLIKVKISLKVNAFYLCNVKRQCYHHAGTERGLMLFPTWLFKYIYCTVIVKIINIFEENGELFRYLNCFENAYETKKLLSYSAKRMNTEPASVRKWLHARLIFWASEECVKLLPRLIAVFNIAFNFQFGDFTWK